MQAWEPEWLWADQAAVIAAVVAVFGAAALTTSGLAPDGVEAGVAVGCAVGTGCAPVGFSRLRREGPADRPDQQY